MVAGIAENLIAIGVPAAQIYVYERFDSQLKLARYLPLQLKNYVLIFLTLGLYWPFAVVSTRRAQIEAVVLETRIDLDEITQTAGRENPGAAGDMAADLFGLDIGM